MAAAPPGSGSPDASRPAGPGRAAGDAGPAGGALLPPPGPGVALRPGGLRLQISPPGLGPVDVRVAVRGTRVHTAFVVAQAGSDGAILGQGEALRHALGDAGLQLAGLQVGVRGDAAAGGQADPRGGTGQGHGGGSGVRPTAPRSRGGPVAVVSPGVGAPRRVAGVGVDLVG